MMAPGKKKGDVANRAMYSRISYLQQAAAHLATSSRRDGSTAEDGALDGVARRLATDMREVSLKMRIRLAPAVKQMVCKYCDSVLVDGTTCTATIENKSRHGKKPWADMLVRRCHTCGKEKRYPVNASRSKRRPFREATENGATQESGTQQQEQGQESMVLTTKKPHLVPGQ